MRAIIGMMLSCFIVTTVLAIIAWQASDPEVAFAAVLMLVCSCGLLWHLTKKYRAKKRGFWVSVGLVLLSLFISIDP